MCARGCNTCRLEPVVKTPVCTPAAIRPEPLLQQVQQQRRGLGGSAAGAAGEDDCEPPWRSAIESLPAHWDEREDVLKLANLEARSKELRFCSRRRAVPESVEELRSRPLPLQAPPPVTAPTIRPVPGGWPKGAPPRPIRVEQLFIKGADSVEAIRQWGEKGQATVRADLGEMEDESSTTEPIDLISKWTELHEWAREIPGGWDTTDVTDVVPVGMRDSAGSLKSMAKGDVNESLIREWARELEYPDLAMLSQLDGVVSESVMEPHTVLMYHHKGFRLNPGPVAELIGKEETAGRVSRGRPFPPTIPFRSVPYNCVTVTKYKMVNGELTSKLKHRVTTDDSIVAEGVDSRNTMIDKESWPDSNLCAVQHLAEAIAIMRTARSPGALAGTIGGFLEALSQNGIPWEVCERIVLWALDLSDAYRMLAVHWSELWQQGFIWKDGFRVNYRCLFGAAHMVGFFQRVSLCVKARADMDIREYDAALPPAVSTQAWMRHLGQRLAGYSMMYIDDALGASFLAPHARYRGAHRSSSTLAGVESRPQGHQRLTAQRFRRGGWAIALEKVELDWRIVGLGIGVDGGDDPACEHDGDIYCPESKRRGMLADVVDLLPNRGEDAERATARQTPRGPVEKLVGRLSNMSQVEPACKPHLAPLFSVVAARRKARKGGGRNKGQPRPPRYLHLHGASKTQILFQEAMQWWRAALERGLASPLAPRRTFPPIDAPGVVAILTDAAREDGTGVGGYAPIVRAGASEPTFLYVSEEWPTWARLALQANTASMPAGEGYGVVGFIDALLGALEGVSHVYVFTDCDAFRAALNGEASGSPQLNELVRWLVERHPHIQLLAFHQPGKRNRAADGLSRNGHGGELASTILDEAREAGMAIEELRLGQESWLAFQNASLLPQRAQRGDSVLPTRAA